MIQALRSLTNSAGNSEMSIAHQNVLHQAEMAEMLYPASPETRTKSCWRGKAQSFLVGLGVTYKWDYSFRTSYQIYAFFFFGDTMPLFVLWFYAYIVCWTWQKILVKYCLWADTLVMSSIGCGNELTEEVFVLLSMWYKCTLYSWAQTLLIKWVLWSDMILYEIPYWRNKHFHRMFYCNPDGALQSEKVNPWMEYVTVSMRINCCHSMIEESKCSLCKQCSW